MPPRCVGGGIGQHLAHILERQPGGGERPGSIATRIAGFCWPEDSDLRYPRHPGDLRRPSPARKIAAITSDVPTGRWMKGVERLIGTRGTVDFIPTDEIDKRIIFSVCYIFLARAASWRRTEPRLEAPSGRLIIRALPF